MRENLSVIKKRTTSIPEKTTEVSKKIVSVINLKMRLKNMLLTFTDNRGATLIEIALYIALVVIVCIGVVTALGDKLQGVFDTIVSSL
jgi:Flp pilus assembly pilin Flp